MLTLLGGQGNPALAIAARIMDDFSDGVWWVELESLNDPSGVLPTVTETLGIASPPDRSLTISLIEYLREKNILLILNHCDQVSNACAQLAGTILETCPDVRILACTRSGQPLNLRNETCFQLS